MAENPQSSWAQKGAMNSPGREDTDGATFVLPSQTSSDITDIARKLAAHGGGTGSLDLALDLVLHDIVERAREATGATGAAIALAREGEMVCRATTGENAPDLGVRVETTSGLVGACLHTGEIQYCRDAESDSRVNREACQRLGVRSMLVLPLREEDRISGFMELFSSAPNAFADQEIASLQLLVQQVRDSTAGVQQSVKAAPMPVEFLHEEREHEFPKSGGAAKRLPEQPYSLQKTSTGKLKANELWTSLLFILVIATAVALGIVIGSTGRASGGTEKVPLRSMDPALESTQKVQIPIASVNSSVRLKDPAPNSSIGALLPTVPDGGLLVTQNGKVIYRSLANSPNLESVEGRRLIHRVEPDYPPDARTQHVEGTVILDAEIKENGHVGTVAVLSGNEVLAEAAVRAVKQWRYQPARNASQTRVDFSFVLPAK